MRRRIAPTFLAVLIGLPVAVPAGAAAPSAPPGDPSAGETSGVPDTTDRWIVVLRKGADAAAVVDRAGKRDRVKADRTFGRTVRGFSAKLDAQQRSHLKADPNVVAVVPDGVVQLTQTIPTGVSRVGGKQSDIAAINGVDHRVDADVAIVDTGITAHPDLNIAGGYNCSTSDPAAWRDRNNHGTHVAGTVGAIDNGIGVVGVAPGARVWGVKILNDDGYGLISWYICGLDWIAGQRDPVDPSRPLFEAVNMSVTKSGSDDGNCGLSNNDLLHQAICRVVGGGVTVVAAAANDSHNAAKNIPASYNEVITVSALADTDGKPGALGGDACYSWGAYDKDDTFANFSNYGADVDIMAPGKCILSTVPGGYATMSGTSMAAPTVAGAVALYKESRPNATPGEVKEALRYLGNLGWKTATDPDPYHEPLLDVARIDELGTFDFAPATVDTVEAGTTGTVAADIVRSPTFFERVRFTITSLPHGWSAAAPASVMGWSANTGQVAVVVPKDAAPGRYEVGVEASNQGRVAATVVPVDVVTDVPTARAPVVGIAGRTMGMSGSGVTVSWPAGSDPSSSIAGYQTQVSVDGGAYGSTVDHTAAQRSATSWLRYETSYRFRVRTVDAAGNWSPWVVGATTKLHPIDDRSASIERHGGWASRSASSAWQGTLIGSGRTGATVSLVFTGHSIAFIGPKGPRRGRATIYIDGAWAAAITMRRSTAASRQIAFVRTFANGGTHRITVRVQGAGKHPNVRLDAFLIGR
jgi:subtilisin family serine protease